jgi:hypothetical protein
MKKGYTKIYMVAILFFIIVALYFGYMSAQVRYTDTQLKNISNNSNYKWITDGTCNSHGMKDLTQSDCSRYLVKSNYNITVADHGPPGCWLVLGEMLDQTMNEQPQFAGKGFACWSENKQDGKQCSANLPCACK